MKTAQSRGLSTARTSVRSVLGRLGLVTNGRLTVPRFTVLARKRAKESEAPRLWSEVLTRCPGDREAQAPLQSQAQKEPCVPEPPRIFFRASVDNPRVRAVISYWGRS
jgi:hypothetical protein